MVEIHNLFKLPMQDNLMPQYHRANYIQAQIVNGVSWLMQHAKAVCAASCRLYILGVNDYEEMVR
jgi:hypothetical protein